MKEKLLFYLEKMPVGVINLFTVISSLITFATPVVGVISLVKLYPKKNGVIIIFLCTIIILLTMLLIMFRYMIKYRKMLIGIKKVTSDSYFNFLRNFRNVYFDLIKFDKTDKLTVELLTVTIEQALQKAMDDICKIYKEFTYQDVSACIKYIDGTEENIDRETATIRTLVRSTNSDSKRSEYDNINSKPIYIKDNTDFYSILSPNSANKKSYFYQRDLIKYEEDLEAHGDSYNNSTLGWKNFYRSTIVVPISIANKRLASNTKNVCYNILGFLCIDSMSTDAFIEKEERYNRDIAQSFAAEIYVILNQYREYCSKLTAKRSR